MLKLSLSEILKNPANFMYLFADEEQFLKKIDRKSAIIISAKKRNQQQVLVNAVGADAYQNALQQVKAAFNNIYGMTPQKALATLAKGGEVAGKNWAKGVYGVGELTQPGFVQNKEVSVMENSGYLVINGESLEFGQMEKVWGKDKKGNTIVTSYSYVDEDGNTFTSQYNPRTGKYAAGTFTTKAGVKENAKGRPVTNEDSSSIWESVVESFQQVIEWIVSLFAGDKTLITAKNTMPNQVQDGFVTTHSSMPWVLVLLLAGGALLYGMPKINGKTNNKEK